MAFNSTFGRVFSPTFQPKSQADTSFSPLDIAGCQLWIDFSDATKLFKDAGVTPVSSDGDAIYQVNDKSGNSYHATQATIANRPLYKTGIKNGLSAGYFDGGDFLTLPSGLAVTLKKQVTGFFVLMFQTISSAARYSWFGSGYWTDGKFIRHVHDTTSKIWLCYGGSKFLAGSVPSINTWYLDMFKWNSINETASLYLNGNPSVTQAVPLNWELNASNSTVLIGKIGGMNSIIGYMSEILVYDTVLSDSDRQSMETYLNSKWSIY